MFLERDLKKWLNLWYPQLVYKRLENGAYGIYQEQRKWVDYEVRDFSFNYLEIGYRPVFIIRNRMLGGWIKDEIQRRDPKLAHCEGNVFHQAWRESRAKDDDKNKRDNYARSRGLQAWETIKRNKKAMNRIYASLAKGDTEQAAKEVTLEELAKNAYKENPSKMKDEGFKREITER